MSANRPFVLGLTGGICSGKSEAARTLSEMGAFHIDADVISRSLTADGGEALPMIREKFGDGVFLPDGALDRSALGNLVFENAGYKRLLEAILHPLIQRDMLRLLDEAAKQNAAVALLDVPLLFETGLDALCDEVWTMYADEETQISRLKARNGLNPQQAKARIDSQMAAEERERLSARVISSMKPLDKMRSEIVNQYQQLLKRIQ